MAQKDFYKILGVSETTSQDDIKKAYKKLAVKYHPDKHLKDKSAAEAKFKEISEAYYVLGNPEKRNQYDMMRKYGYQGAGAGGGYSGASNGFNSDDFLKQFMGGGRRKRSSWSSMGGDYSIFDDIFGSAFSMGGAPGGGTSFRFTSDPGMGGYDRLHADDSSSQQIDTDFTKSINLTPQQARTGGKIKLKLSTGQVLMVNIPQDAKQGQKLKIPRQGNVCPCCRKKGDLLLELNIK
ncbi:MAG: DnaJ domain-containing protein [Candidatus Omnitrophica bacterium]|nr:DnaJ domain-containing protein [Candidatus Omnitrophota bacterium]